MGGFEAVDVRVDEDGDEDGVEDQEQGVDDGLAHKSVGEGVGACEVDDFIYHETEEGVGDGADSDDRVLDALWDVELVELHFTKRGHSVVVNGCEDVLVAVTYFFLTAAGDSVGVDAFFSDVDSLTVGGMSVDVDTAETDDWGADENEHQDD